MRRRRGTRSSTTAAAQEKAEHAIRRSWVDMRTNTRQADADEAADQVADDYTAFADAVIAEPTECLGVLCPERLSACANCGLRLEAVLFQR